MPLYDYRCPSGHITERLRKYDERDAATACKTCQQPATRTIALPHCMPDGMYSYAPNVGSQAAFERRLDAMKNGQKTIKREPPMPDSHRDGQLTPRATD